MYKFSILISLVLLLTMCKQTSKTADTQATKPLITDNMDKEWQMLL